MAASWRRLARVAGMMRSHGRELAPLANEAVRNEQVRATKSEERREVEERGSGDEEKKNERKKGHVHTRTSVQPRLETVASTCGGRIRRRSQRSQEVDKPPNETIPDGQDEGCGPRQARVASIDEQAAWE